MLPVQQAVKRSVTSFSELYPKETFQDLRLEEVSISKDEQRWYVTLSYKNPDIDEELRVQQVRNGNPLLGMVEGDSARISPRHYKKVTLNASDGSLLSVKNA